MDKLKVVALIDSKILGGPGKGLLQLACHLPVEAIELRVVNFSYECGVQSGFVKAFAEKNISIDSIKHKVPVIDLLALFKFYKLVKRLQPEILQSHGYKAHIYCWIISKISGLPWVAVNHGFTTENFKVRVYHLLDSLSVRFANVAVCVSQILLDKFKKIRGDKKLTVLITNAVEMPKLESESLISSLKKELAYQLSDEIYGVFGRLSSEKGINYLIDALSNLRSDGYLVKLLVLGSGTEEKALKEQVSRLGLDSQVRFIPATSEIGKYFQLIDCLILPSLSEGMPNVVLEALSYGKPVIASQVGEVAKVVRQEGNGLLVPAADINALANAIKRVGDELSRFKEGAQELLPEEYSVEYRVKKFVDLYKLVGSRN